MQKTNSNKCFLCSSTEDLTRDHIPPESFFKPPLPTNLITVTACSKCNGSYSLDEEYFRASLTSQTGTGSGKWIWDNKVVRSTFARSPKLKQDIARRIVTLPVYSPAGLYLGTKDAVLFKWNRISRVLGKIARGLFSVYRPEIDMTDIGFTIGQPQLTSELPGILSQLKREVVREDTFTFWRGFNADDQRMSFWFMLFYKQVLFSVVSAAKALPKNAG